MAPPSDERSGVATGVAWASRIMSIALEMALPGLAGYWLDGRLGTRVVFTLIGVTLGLALGGWQLAMIAREGSTGSSGHGEERNDGD